MARLLVQQGKADAAESIVKQAVAAIGDDPELQLDLAALYAGSNEFDRAEDALKEAVRLDPAKP